MPRFAERRIKPPELHCTVCGAPGSGGFRCSCGGPLDLPDIPATGIDRLDPRIRSGVWRYGSWLPVPVPHGLSMGEGDTALIAAGDDLPGLWLKLEFVSPTSSFKDRGAVVLVAAAAAGGATSLVADSSGNAGSAIAAYAARAELSCTVFVPGATSAGKQAQIRSYGASLEVVPGDRTATGRAAMAFVSETGATYASHVYDPMFLQGTKTFAFECWEQLGRAPDAVILPVGNGTLVLGAARGFRELRGAGVISRLPRVIALQSERCSPLASAWALGLCAPRPASGGPPTVAEGIAIPAPPRGRQILAAVRETGGSVLAVPEAAIGAAQADLARRGLFVEPTAALTWAGARLLRCGASVAAGGFDYGSLDPGRWPRRTMWEPAADMCDGTVVVPLCGSGLKSG